jgi:hypothetical protein
MARSELDTVTEDSIQKGGVLVKLYFDMQDKEKDRLQPFLVNLINEHLLKEKGVIYCYGSIDEPIEIKGLYSTNAVVTLLAESLIPLIGIAFNYAPAGIEVLRPEKGLLLKANDMQAILIDLSQISINYSKYVLEKVLKPEDLEKINLDMENRTRVGKSIMGKSDGDKKEEAGNKEQ